MNDKKHLRKKLWINQEVQGAIICRTVLHWFFYMTAIIFAVVIYRSWIDPDEMAIRFVYDSFEYFAPAVLASVLLLPCVVYDTLKETHRVAGPIHRLKAEMTELASGGPSRNLKFRDGDHWSDIADTFNFLSESHEQLRTELKELKEELARRQPEAVIG